MISSGKLIEWKGVERVRMKSFLKRVVVLMGLMTLFMVMSIAALADEQTIFGTINKQYQITAQDGTVYKVAEADRDPELLQGVGKKIEVVGDVTKENGAKTITIIDFSIID